MCVIFVQVPDLTMDTNSLFSLIMQQVGEVRPTSQRQPIRDPDRCH